MHFIHFAGCIEEKESLTNKENKEIYLLLIQLCMLHTKDTIIRTFSIYEQPKQVRVRVGVWVIYYIYISVACILRKHPMIGLKFN